MSDNPARVLVVEDEADIRRFVRLALQAEGHEVFEADTLQFKVRVHLSGSSRSYFPLSPNIDLPPISWTPGYEPAALASNSAGVR